MEKMLATSREIALLNIEHTMRAEGFKVPAQVRQECRQVLSGQIKADQAVAKYIREYSSKPHE